MGLKVSSRANMIGWLQAAPLALVLGGFLVVPVIMIVVVSFWGATAVSYTHLTLPTICSV